MYAREDELSGLLRDVGGFRVERELRKGGLFVGGRRGCGIGSWFSLEERNSSNVGVGRVGSG